LQEIDFFNNCRRVYLLLSKSTTNKLFISALLNFDILANCKAFLSTPSAMGIIVTRYYELMTLGTICIEPEESTEYAAGKEILKEQETCILYGKNTNSFLDSLEMSKFNKEVTENIIIKAKKEMYFKNTYSERISNLTKKLKLLEIV